LLNRKKTLLIFGILYLVFVGVLFFGLKYRLKNKFSVEGLNKTISGKSVFRDTTTDLCKYQILGDPKEEGNYVKINIFCSNGKKAVSTVSLSAIEDRTVGGFMAEYARIAGFEMTLFNEQNFVCYLDGKLLTDEMMKDDIRPTSTIDCTENPNK